ncbi:uncharacterized protein [Hoplias malabaricus]|uniref:uncharacterized protein n=1 Tax=Hoplias malabaricus TaxID=27720 RepID=UPI003461FDDB
MMDYSGATALGSKVEFEPEINSRGMTEVSVKGKHLSLEDLRKHILSDSTVWKKVLALRRKDSDQFKSASKEKPKILDNLQKDIPDYPKPVEFHISSVAHVTDKNPFLEILKSEEIKSPANDFSWWTLAVSKEEIKSAENCYLQSNNIQRKKTFLEKFTTSPVFQLDKSRYGNYRLTFPLAELINLYQEQNCDGKEPVLRMFKTMFYKQEIVYAVLIHSPEDNEHFEKLPLLEESRFADYRDGEMIWQAQAISSELKFRISLDPLKGQLSVRKLRFPQFYVWDHVCLAFHLPFQKALKVPRKRLIESFDACRLQERNLIRCNDNTEMESKFTAAKERENSLKKELEN